MDSYGIQNCEPLSMLWCDSCYICEEVGGDIADMYFRVGVRDLKRRFEKKIDSLESQKKGMIPLVDDIMKDSTAADDIEPILSDNEEKQLGEVGGGSGGNGESKKTKLQILQTQLAVLKEFLEKAAPSFSKYDEGKISSFLQKDPEGVEEGAIVENRKVEYSILTKSFKSLLEVSHNDISEKLKVLIEVLRQYSPSESDTSLESIKEDDTVFCAIVFVERRFMAMLLKNVLEKIPELSFLKIGVLVGHGGGPSIHNIDIMMSFRKQQQIVDGFKHGEINLLIATSVRIFYLFYSRDSHTDFIFLFKKKGR